MIDPRSENLITLNKARSLPWLPGRGGGRLDIGTIQRWARRGVRGVVLETVRIGNTNYTTETSILQFLERLNESTLNTGRATPPKQHARAVAAANRRLDAAGL